MTRNARNLLGLAVALGCMQVASAAKPTYGEAHSPKSQTDLGVTHALGGSGGPAMTDALGGSGGPAMTDALGGSGGPAMTDALGGSGGPAMTDALGGSGSPGSINGKTQLVAVGPIAVDATFRRLSVLGQEMRIGSTVASMEALGIEPDSTSSNLFAISGTREIDGSITVTRLENLQETYVPGASRLMIRALVEEVDGAKGRLRIGAAWVDYNSVLSATGFEAVRPGDIVTIGGIQPLRNGEILAMHGSLDP